VVLVTLGGCHLLDGLAVVSLEARKEDYALKGDKWSGQVKC
jgi:hypothetical protein